MAIIDDALEDLGLGSGDFVEILEIAEMSGGDRGDDSHMRANHPDQRPISSGWFMPISKIAEISVFRHAGQRQRHAPMIVERGNRRMHPAGRRQQWRSISFVVVLPTEPVTAMIFAALRSRAAQPSRTIASSTSSTTIIGAIRRPSAGSFASLTTSSSGAIGNRDAGIIVAVDPVALDREECFALGDGAAVDRDPGNAFRQVSHRPAVHGRHQVADCPEKAQIIDLPMLFGARHGRRKAKLRSRSSAPPRVPCRRRSGYHRISTERRQP